MGNADHLMPLGNWLSHKEVTVEEDEEEDKGEEGEEKYEKLKMIE